MFEIWSYANDMQKRFRRIMKNPNLVPMIFAFQILKINPEFWKIPKKKTDENRKLSRNLS